jgi:hypothetical protein
VIGVGGDKGVLEALLFVRVDVSLVFVEILVSSGEDRREEWASEAILSGVCLKVSLLLL